MLLLAAAAGWEGMKPRAVDIPRALLEKASGGQERWKYATWWESLKKE